MRNMDTVLALLALGTLVAFLGVMIVSVTQIPLIVVCGLGLAMAAYDFLRQLTVQRRYGRRP